MKKRTLFIAFTLGFLTLTLTGGLLLKERLTTPRPPAARVAAAPTVLTGSLEGGCYLITPTTCKINVEPFDISIAPGETLLSFHLSANDQIIYDFGASTANSVTGNYSPSSVALDFAAACGKTYSLELQALDTGDLDFVTIGQTDSFTCPKATFKLFMPVVKR